MHLSDMEMRYSSLDTVKNSIVARAKLIHGCPGTIVSRVFALDVSHMWCCKRYVSRVVLPRSWRDMLTPDRIDGVMFRKNMYDVRGMMAKYE